MIRRALALLMFTSLVSIGVGPAAELHVSPAGDDRGPGTSDQPFRTLEAAQRASRRARAGGAEGIMVVLHRGTYALSGPLVLTAEDSGSPEAPLVFATAPGEEAVISGGTRLELAWEPDRDGVFKARVPEGLVTDQLFIDGEPRPLARYPNFDPGAAYYGGTAADAIERARAGRWADPKGGLIHAMHREMWGDFHYVITGKAKDGGLAFEGGWQNNRRMGMHPSLRFVENIREELDAPGEWFLDGRAHLLYFRPPAGLDLRRAVVEAVRLRHLVEVRGTTERPVRSVAFRGLTFRHASRTFMENREPLLRSDWTIYRGGAIVFAGAEDCTLEDCLIDRVGGNAVFVTGYNRRVAIRGCEIVGAGANGVAFVGDPVAVRSPLFEYHQRQRLDRIDRAPGPRSPDYPADCVVDDCLIHRTGRIEKQSAPVEIAMARRIVVRHCSIYDVPRAGINIGDGCWGGHRIESCDVFDTVKETGDHGSFNSWGRDRYWGLEGIDPNAITAGDDRDLPRLDVVEPIVLRGNRWRCDHGWDIDLDDGSTHFEIRENLCLNGGIKLREGFDRIVENNIMVGNSFHPHVWFRGSADVFRRNIVAGPYRPIGMSPPWGAECDFNVLHEPGRSEPIAAEALAKRSGLDEHSIVADARFVDPSRGDYRVREGSPALCLGFRNFPMDRFGVRRPALRARARTPQLPAARALGGGTTDQRR